MFGGQSRFLLIKLFDTVRGCKVRLKQRSLTVLVQIGGRIGNRRRKIVAKTSKVKFASAACGGNDHAIAAGEFVHERTARGSAIDDGKRTRKRFEPACKLVGRDVGATKVELCLVAIECAVT